MPRFKYYNYFADINKYDCRLSINCWEQYNDDINNPFNQANLNSLIIMFKKYKKNEFQKLCHFDVNSMNTHKYGRELKQDKIEGGIVSNRDEYDLLMQNRNVFKCIFKFRFKI